MSKCPFCGGKLQARTITHVQSYLGKVYVLENVSAEVCSRCGEVLIAPDVLEKVQHLIWSNAEPTRTEEVPVYDLAKIG